eukprot:363702-Chlamydomonas_euryale.AAC.3
MAACCRLAGQLTLAPAHVRTMFAGVRAVPAALDEGEQPACGAVQQGRAGASSPRLVLPHAIPHPRGCHPRRNVRSADAAGHACRRAARWLVPTAVGRPRCRIAGRQHQRQRDCGPGGCGRSGGKEAAGPGGDGVLRRARSSVRTVLVLPVLPQRQRRAQDAAQVGGSDAGVVPRRLPAGLGAHRRPQR